MSRESRKAARNKDGISYAGDTRASEANDGKDCDKGGDRHGGHQIVVGHTDKIQMLKRGRVLVSEWRMMRCTRCGREWDEPTGVKK
jgi:hypothetical protein